MRTNAPDSYAARCRAALGVAMTPERLILTSVAQRLNAGTYRPRRHPSHVPARLVRRARLATAAEAVREVLAPLASCAAVAAALFALFAR